MALETARLLVKPLVGGGIYVSPSGNDLAEGGKDSPLKTISAAIGRAVPGTVIYLYSGVWQERVVLRTSGTESDPIIISAVSGETPVLDGGNGKGWSQDTETGRLLMTDFAATDAALPGFDPDAALFTLDCVSYITIRGLTVTGSPECGIYCKGGSSWVTIEDCNISDCVGPGICFGADYAGESYRISSNITVRNNHLSNCAQRAREAVSLRSVTDFEVYGNVVEKVIKESIDAKSGCSRGSIHHNRIIDAGHVAIYLDGGYSSCPEESDIKVHSNIIENPYGGGICVASESGNDISGIRIYNNLIWCRRPDNRGNGLKVAKNSNDTSGKISDIFMYNNTVRGFCQQGIYVNYPNVANIVISNNISIYNMDNMALSTSNNVPENQIRAFRNLVYGGLCSYAGADHIEEDPLLNEDYTLRPGSPAVDAGSDEYAPSEDLSGKSRPRGGHYDIGAYEL